MIDYSQKKRRILVIDDNHDIHKDFRKCFFNEELTSDAELDALEAVILKKEKSIAKSVTPYLLDSAFQGKQGYEMVLQALEEKDPYLMAFVDMRMPPGWDGLETIKHLWTADPLLQVVICTAYSDHSWQDITNELGVSDKLLILKKPFDCTEINQMAQALSEKRILAYYADLKLHELEELVEEKTKERETTLKKVYQAAKYVALGEMAGGIAHEINNPLAIIKGYSTILLDTLRQKPVNDAILRQYTERIQVTVERIAKIVNSMRILMSRSNAGGVPLSVKALFDDVLALCLDQLKKDEIILDLDWGDVSENMIIQSGEVQLAQALLNIILNAREALISCVEEKKWIKVLLVRNGKMLTISISNNGSPIPEAIMERIFEPFFTTKDPGEGTGLGLSVAKSIIEDHGGTIELNTKSKNTDFHIVLPIV